MAMNNSNHNPNNSTSSKEQKVVEEDSLGMASPAAAATNPSSESSSPQPSRQRPRRIVRRSRAAQQKESVFTIDPVVLEQILQQSNLPAAYDFEIVKTVQRCVELQTTHIALQMPEGLLLFANTIADILRTLVPCLQTVSVLGDVVYGACCIDDLTAQSLGCQLLVHYGHSCLVPMPHTVIPVLYVFVEIQVDTLHLVRTIQATMIKAQPTTTTTIALLGTVQFRHALATVQTLLRELGYEQVSIPQVKPLSPGEVLGCTSPKIPESSSHEKICVVFVADGRFHLEATMIANPHVSCFYRYDPYTKIMTEEKYEYEQMQKIRQDAMIQAQSAQRFGIVLGTLGRQGNPAIVQRIREVLNQRGKRHFLMLLSEITPHKLHLLEKSVDAWVQVACPRLSVDWGHLLSRKPVLSSYELMKCMTGPVTSDMRDYPMDFYSLAGGPWANYHPDNRERIIKGSNGTHSSSAAAESKSPSDLSQVETNT
jgi:2-(3-amino-3-carboxypropyl)histidine synthase